MRNKLKALGVLLVFLGGVCEVDGMQSEEESTSQETKETMQSEEDFISQEVEENTQEDATPYKRPNFRGEHISFYETHPNSKFLKYHYDKTHLYPKKIKQIILSPEEQEAENEALMDLRTSYKYKARKKKNNKDYKPMTLDEEAALRRRNQEHAVIRDKVLYKIEHPENHEFSDELPEEGNSANISGTHVTHEYPMNEQELEFQLTRKPYKDWPEKKKNSARKKS